MKPRISLSRGFSGCFRWKCVGHHKDELGRWPTTAFGKTPAEAYRSWLTYWEIPF